MVACKGFNAAKGLQASSRTELKPKMYMRNWRMDQKIKRLKWKMSLVQIAGRKSELHAGKQEHKGRAEALQKRLWSPNASQTGPGSADDVGVDDD